MAKLDNSCGRIHKAWHLIDDSEKELFISAIHKLNDQGKLSYFSLTHHFLIDSHQSHYSSAFFPWHRYFIYQVISLLSIHKYFNKTNNTKKNILYI